MEEQMDSLVQKTWEKYQSLAKSKRLLIGVAGIPGSGKPSLLALLAIVDLSVCDHEHRLGLFRVRPGSSAADHGHESIVRNSRTVYTKSSPQGKTTLAARVVEGVNAKFAASSPALAAGSKTPVAAFIPMDGYHLTRAQLSAMPDPSNAHARRGAAFTFDGDAFLELIHRVREPLMPESVTLYAPSFDHAKKDPVDNDIAIPPSSRVLLFEGNYVALDEDPWRTAASLMDEIWFVDIDEDRARCRLVARHVTAGIAKDEDEANKRVSENDLVNGREIIAKRVKVDEVVQSVEDERWRPG